MVVGPVPVGLRRPTRLTVPVTLVDDPVSVRVVVVVTVVEGMMPVVLFGGGRAGYKVCPPPEIDVIKPVGSIR